MPHQPLHRRHIIPYLRQAGVVGKVDVARLPIAVFGHNRHSQPFRRIFALALTLHVMHGRTIKQHHHVRILFYRPTLTQVAQRRAAIGTSLAGTVQLTEQQYRHIQFLRHQFRLAGGLRHLLFAVAVILPRIHLAQLQVVQDNQVALPLALQHPRHSAHMIHAHHRTVVHSDRKPRQFHRGFPHLPQLTCIELPVAQVRRIYIFRSCKQPPVSQPLALHLQTENHRVASRRRSRPCQVQREGRLSHRRTRGDDNRVALLPSTRHLVQFGQPGGNARDAVLIVLHASFHLHQRILHQLLHAPEMVGGAQRPFQAVQQIVHTHQDVRNVHRLIRGGSQLLVRPQYRLPADVQFLQYGNVIFQMRPRRHATAQARHVVGPSRRFQFAAGCQFALHGEDVNRQASMVHAQHGGENQPVCLVVEHLRANLPGNQRHGFALYQTGAHHRFFHLLILRIPYFLHFLQFTDYHSYSSLNNPPSR